MVTKEVSESLQNFVSHIQIAQGEWGSLYTRAQGGSVIDINIYVYISYLHRTQVCPAECAMLWVVV